MISAHRLQHGALAAAELRHFIWRPLLPAAALTLLLPFFFGAENLDAFASASLLERFCSLAAIPLLPALLAPEQNPASRDAVFSKRIPHTAVLAWRLALSVPVLYALIALFALYMRLGGCRFDTSLYTLGAFITALFLGSVGYAAHAVSDNPVIGYLAPLSLWALAVFSDGYIGPLDLFSLLRASFSPKALLMLLSALLLVLGTAWRALRERHR